MKFLTKAKDGGSNSPVDAYFLFEIKGLMSIALLKFNKGERENYHTHAFDALTWFLWGDLVEERVNYLDKSVTKTSYKRSILPKFTRKDNLHRVVSNKTSWCFTVRGKWDNMWTEYNNANDETHLISCGRVLEKTVEGLHMVDEIGGKKWHI